MNEDNALIVEQNETEWKKMEFVLRAYSEKCVVWVMADTGNKINVIEKKIQESFPEANHIIKWLETDERVRPFGIYLEREVFKKLAPNKKNIVHIRGADSFLNDEHLLAQQLNVERDSLFRNLPFVLIFYTNNAAIVTLQRSARDFWDWLVHVFEFRTLPSELTERTKGFKEQIELSSGRSFRIHDKDIRARIAQLEQELKTFQPTDRKADKIEVMMQLAQEYKELPDYEKAKGLYEKALELVKNDSKFEIKQAVIENNLGLVLKDLGELREAKRLFQKSLASDLKNFGENHPFVAIRQNNLAGVLYGLGELQVAKVLFQKAISSDLKNFGENHPSVAIRQNNLAGVLYNLGELQEAKVLYQNALASALKNFGENHPTVATGQNNLALVLEGLGELQEAKVFFQKALASALKNFGEIHPQVAIYQNNLAGVLKDLGELQEAKALYLKALDSDVKNFGENHQNVATVQNNLAGLLKDLGELQEAKLLYERSLASDLKNFGENHPSVAIRQNNLAGVLYDLGELQEAKIYSAKAYNTFKNLFGDDHYQTKILKGVYEDILRAIKKQPK